MIKINDLKNIDTENYIKKIDDLIDTNYQEKIINDSYCYLSIDDISNKESLVLKSILKSLNIKFYNLEDIINDYSFFNEYDLFMLISKIINYGIKNIILDIKIGNNITEEEAKTLAQKIISIGNKYNINITCFGSSINLSIGNSFGNNLEIKEVIDILNGNINNSFAKLSIKYASYIVSNVKKISLEDADKLVIENIGNKNGYNILKELVDLNKLNLSSKIFSIKSSKSGFIKNIIVDEIKDLLAKVGNEYLDVGIKLSKEVGDYVLENEELAQVYLNELDILTTEVLECFEIKEQLGEVNSLIRLIVR